MKLTVQTGTAAGRQIDLSAGTVVIGRDASADVALEDEKISRRHVRLTPGEDGTAVLEDLGSTNGTFVAGRRVTAPVVLRGGELVRLGDTELSFHAPPVPPPTGKTTVEPRQPVTAGAPRPVATAPSASPPGERPSVIERIALKKSVRRSMVIAAVAVAGVLVAIVVVVLFVTGVFGGESKTPTATEIISGVKPSTIQVRGVDKDGSTFGLGTGWVYDAEKGLVVTNAHVVNAADAFSVRLAEETTLRPAKVVAVAECDDLALLKVKNTSGMQTLELGSQSELAQGDSVIALGYPTSLATRDPLITTEGVVSVVQARTSPNTVDQPLPNVIQTDAVINPGNSGGPLVDDGEQLVGVNTLKTVATGVEGQFYAIGVDRVKELVPKLAGGTSSGWPSMSFEFLPTSDDLANLGLPAEAGVVITGAIPGSAAAKHGWSDGPFLLTAIDGTAMDGSKRGYCKAVGSYEKGESAVFTVVASGSSQTQDVNVDF